MDDLVLSAAVVGGLIVLFILLVALFLLRRYLLTRPVGAFDCSLRKSRTVPGGWMLGVARYEPDRALVLIRAPGTAVNLESSLLHEYAHHVERRCPTDTAFRRRYVAAAELPAGTAWSGGGRWDRIPSERFAEAAVIRVLGQQPPHVLIHVHPAEVALVDAWAGGG